MSSRSSSGVPSLLASWIERGGGPVVFLPPDGPPAALFRAAGLLPLPARHRPPRGESLHGAVELPLPAEWGAPEPEAPVELFLDRVEAILAGLGGEEGHPVTEGALCRALDGERRLSEALSAGGMGLPTPGESEAIPPAALLLRFRVEGRGGTGEGEAAMPSRGADAATGGTARLPPSPFRDGIRWKGEGDPRLYAATAWRLRLRSL